MLNIGPGEVILIALVLLIAVGPEQLPSLIRRVGQTVSQVRGMTEGLRTEFMSGLDEIERATDPNAWAASAGPSNVSPPAKKTDGDDDADTADDDTADDAAKDTVSDAAEDTADDAAKDTVADVAAETGEAAPGDSGNPAAAQPGDDGVDAAASLEQPAGKANSSADPRKAAMNGERPAADVAGTADDPGDPKVEESA